ncbi:DUF3850 domain-containing protein [Rhodococcus sp. ARP2]|uniref:DUF3850 domain-containing protein n=1 Tax=Rhodococcus sp. ARP2 TaxID=1661385 RepID=UPI00064C0B59|nr:DUF3850 domain-containing protein [Rhodococcus sp. ARP2]
MTIHTLKLDPQWFDRVANGTKRVEIRRADRDYQIGDQLVMREIESTMLCDRYTEREVTVDVTHVLYIVPGLSEGYVALSISNPRVQEPGESATTEGDSQ